MQNSTTNSNFAHIKCVTKTKLERLLYLLLKQFPIAGSDRFNAGDCAMHLKDDQGVGQLVRILSVPGDGETRY